jgi:hypothetical protein
MSLSQECQLKHLEFVQGIISRMAQNSHTAKGWSVTLVTLALTITQATNAASGSSLIALIPAFSFWYIDAFYLRQERIFRKLYNAISFDIREGAARVALLDISPVDFEKQVPGLLSTLFSKTVCPIPLTVIVVSLMVFILNSH